MVSPVRFITSNATVAGNESTNPSQATCLPCISLPHPSLRLTKQGLDSQRQRMQLTLTRARLDNLICKPRIPKHLKSSIKASIGMAFIFLLSLRERGIILGSNSNGP